jgi:hypothetical protein
MKLSRSVFALAATAFAGASLAQTVTVKQNGTGNYTSIAAAIASFSPDPNPSLANVIQVQDSATYQEVITIPTPMVIEATGTERATICLESNSRGTRENGGIVVDLPSDLSTGTVVLRNFTILPALNTTSIRLRTAIENTNNNLFLWIDKCLICPNDGTDKPIVTDGTTSRIYNIFPGTEANPNPDVDLNIVQFGDKGIVLGRTDTGYSEGAGVELLFKDSIISHFRNDFTEPAPKPVPYCIQMNSSYVYDQLPPYPTEFRLTRVEGESAISFSLIGLHATGDVQFKSSGERIRMRGLSNEAIHFVGPAQNFRNIEDAIIDGCSNNIIWDQGFGSVRMSMKHCILYYAGRYVIMVRKPVNDNASGLMTIEDSTLIGGRDINATVHTYRFEPGTEVDMVFRNCIVGGKKNLPSAAANVISLAGTNTCTLIGTAILTEGPFALRASNPFSRSLTSVVIGTATTSADPMFMDVEPTAADPQRPNWLDPTPNYMNVQNTAYATADENGGPLGGGAEYVGASPVVDWAVY